MSEKDGTKNQGTASRMMIGGASCDFLPLPALSLQTTHFSDTTNTFRSRIFLEQNRRGKNCQT
jgi:hypothetical protein